MEAARERFERLSDVLSKQQLEVDAALERARVAQDARDEAEASARTAGGRIAATEMKASVAAAELKRLRDRINELEDASAVAAASAAADKAERDAADADAAASRAERDAIQAELEELRSAYAGKEAEMAVADATLKRERYAKAAAETRAEKLSTELRASVVLSLIHI